MQFFWGVLIADLQNHPSTAQFISNYPRLSKILSAALVSTGLTFASFPEGHAEWMTWSNTLLNLMRPILPENPDFPRFASGIGLELISLGVLVSPALQKVLSGRALLFLGRMSFAVYLLHGPLMRTALVWMLYGVRVPPDHENGTSGDMEVTRLQYPGHLALVLWQVVWLPMLYCIASLWMAYVDPWCERVTNRLVEYVTFDAPEKPSVLPTR
jgi:peptidoglycan/LPS O-acetylase OafA/YrhL